MQKNYPNYILPKTLDVLNEIKEKNGNTAPSESHLNGMKVSGLIFRYARNIIINVIAEVGDGHAHFPAKTC